MADKPDYVNGQPAPLPGTGKSIHDLVRRDLIGLHSPQSPIQNQSVRLVGSAMADRKTYGLEKYGTILQANNGRDSATDAFEEALDLAVYLRQWIEEAEQQEDQSGRDKVAQQMMKLAYRATLQNLIFIQTVMVGRA